ncbi:PRC-barrel domain-containing protein [Candidatus Saccharibacteria bacterium]|nr:PRC-barrel domain-containing protein [Candidatus Saccharibacteria bacterium]
MLLLGSRLIGTPIMGLQTGTKLAQTATPLIDPANLKIMAYVVEGPLLVERPSLIRVADVRELSDIGMIIDSNDEFIGVDDVIKIHELYELGFKLVGMNVIDETNRKLGKVDDYSLDSSSFVIQQLSVQRSLIKSLTDTALLIHRSQIVEINDTYIVVQTTAQKLQSVNQVERRPFVNPFRATSTQPELTDAY